jgi:hypothetical protein
MPCPFEVATDDLRINGIIVTIDSSTKRAERIQRLEFKDPHSDAMAMTPTTANPILATILSSRWINAYLSKSYNSCRKSLKKHIFVDFPFFDGYTCAVLFAFQHRWVKDFLMIWKLR